MQQLNLPRLPLSERDRRWAAVRAQMDARRLDCLVLFGWPLCWDFNTANARYLCPIGGNNAFNIFVFPREGEPTCYVYSSVMLPYWHASQDWVTDIRARKGSWAKSVAERLKELKLDSGRVGCDGLAGALDPDGWIPYSTYKELGELVSGATFQNLGDMLEVIRCIKSADELAFMRRAARLGDMMLLECAESARPGQRECEVYARMQQTMVANGGEEPTLFLWGAGASPQPHPFHVPTMRKLERGDLITCELHPKYAGYSTHVERTFCLGDPPGEYLDIYAGCLEAYETGLKNFGPGKPISVAMEAVKQAIEARGLGMCETGIHGHGLGSLEYPRYRHHAIQADQAALATLGDQFRPGMVFAFNIDLFNPKFRNGETGCVFAETVVITDEGAHRMHEFNLNFQSLPV
ncbi:MAG: hydrolase/M24 family peptidase [Ramlibacter sp.]|nr:hydrolase/M24 family peptidase [Ramlibacter sp.]